MRAMRIVSEAAQRTADECGCDVYVRHSATKEKSIRVILTQADEDDFSGSGRHMRIWKAFAIDVGVKGIADALCHDWRAAQGRKAWLIPEYTTPGDEEASGWRVAQGWESWLIPEYTTSHANGQG